MASVAPMELWMVLSGFDGFDGVDGAEKWFGGVDGISGVDGLGGLESIVDGELESSRESALTWKSLCVQRERESERERE